MPDSCENLIRTLVLVGDENGRTAYPLAHRGASVVAETVSANERQMRVWRIRPAAGSLLHLYMEALPSYGEAAWRLFWTYDVLTALEIGPKGRANWKARMREYEEWMQRARRAHASYDAKLAVLMRKATTP